MAFRSKRRIKRQDRTPYRATYQRTRGKATRLSLKTILILIMALALLAGLVATTTLRKVNIKGDLNSELASMIHDEVRKKYSSSLMLIKESRVEEELKSQYRGEIRGVEVSKDWFRRSLVVEVVAREPAILWQGRQGVFALDQTGVAIRPRTAEDKGLPLVVDVSKLEVGEGDKVATEQFVSFARELAKSSPVKIRELRVIDTTSELYADTDEGYTVRFSTGHSVNDQINNLKKVIRAAKRQGVIISQYVDLRIPYKAYYQ